MKTAIRKFGRQLVVEKPCRNLGYCPYGPLVEQFPLLLHPTPQSCGTYGHNCPVFTCAEPFQDRQGVTA